MSDIQDAIRATSGGIDPSLVPVEDAPPKEPCCLEPNLRFDVACENYWWREAFKVVEELDHCARCQLNASMELNRLLLEVV